MGNQLLNDHFIRQRSEELKIPYENLLVASVLEEIVNKIAQSYAARFFWIKNYAKLNLESYRKKIEFQLHFFMKEGERFHYKKADISSLSAEIFRNYKKEAIHWNYRVCMDGKIIYIDVTAEIANVKVPVKINLEPVRQEKLIPYSREMKLYTLNNRKVTLLCFPSEYVIAEKFVEVLDKLELLNDLSCYMEIYHILKNEILSGRKVWELLMEGCKGRKISIEHQRYDLWMSYRTNRYMQQKWKAYLRKENRKNPDWKEVMDLSGRFFSVIWDHMCRNIVYLGDWMPELERCIE